MKKKKTNYRHWISSIFLSRRNYVIVYNYDISVPSLPHTSRSGDVLDVINFRKIRRRRDGRETFAAAIYQHGPRPP